MIDLPLVLAAFVLETRWAILASVLLVLVVLIAWKFLKLAFKIALIVAVAIGIFFVLRAAGIL